MKYFLPDWEDRVHTHFNFEEDFSPSTSKNAYQESVYAHEIFAEPPYDGLLISLALYADKHLYFENEKPLIRGFNDIRKYLRLDSASKPLAVMGDCGAFSYVNHEVPPVTPKEVADLYHALNFDFGISPDHIILDSITVDGKPYTLSRKEKEARRKITLTNADEFLKYVKANAMRFTPLGVVQGYDETSYRDSLHQLLDMNYEYVAIGGLVRYPNRVLQRVVETVMCEIRTRQKDVKVHLLGVLRPALLERFKELGASSFDSASFMRKAWLRSTMNYLGVDGKWYASIRVPQSFNPLFKKSIGAHSISHERLLKMERAALRALSDYGRKRLSLGATLSAVMEYDSLLERESENLKKLHTRYRHTLESRIWERCPCEVCRTIGVHVVIFRGTNRNKRRGMHNTWMFYQKQMKGKLD
jgi:queuine/archaeosine tRNA-ribosyltransferase